MLSFVFKLPCSVASGVVKPVNLLHVLGLLDAFTSVVAIEMSVWTAANTRVCAYVYNGGGELLCRCRIYGPRGRVYVGDFADTLGALLGLERGAVIGCSRACFQQSRTECSARADAAVLRECGDLVL